MKDIYVTLATFLTQLKKLYKDIKIIRVSPSSKVVISFPSCLLLQMIYHNKIKRLDINKATQETDIPTKLVKRFGNLIVDYLQENFSNCL